MTVFVVVLLVYAPNANINPCPISLRIFLYIYM